MQYSRTFPCKSPSPFFFNFHIVVWIQRATLSTSKGLCTPWGILPLNIRPHMLFLKLLSVSKKGFPIQPWQEGGEYSGNVAKAPLGTQKWLCNSSNLASSEGQMEGDENKITESLVAFTQQQLAPARQKHPCLQAAI